MRIRLLPFLATLAILPSWGAKTPIGQSHFGKSGDGVLYVDWKAKGLGDGSSWQNAFTDLGEALEKRSKWEIWVAAGTYKPGRGSDSIGSTFKLGAGVTLRGGFAGSEAYLLLAKPGVNRTILSGDIGKPGEYSDNAKSVVWAEGDNLVDGFEITAGNGRDVEAGGLSAVGEVEVARCTFTRNRSKYGTGGVIISDAQALIRDCIFEDNSGQHGGAINSVRSDIVIQNCAFHGNKSVLWGGGVLLQEVENATISNCTFYGNSAPNGSGLAVAAATEALQSEIQVVNSIFWKNKYADGKDSNDSEIMTHRINAQNGVLLKMRNCMVQGGIAPRGHGVRIGDTLSSRLEAEKVRDLNPKLLFEKDKVGIFGNDRIPFTTDDGMNVQAGSPAIDAGATVSALEIDITGKNRTKGKGTDIGAYEN